ncbi:peroxin [Xylographa opegraphella]|nr:peroxin [Xylographa opegraphella]
MISATRRWLRRNRSTFAISFGVLGVGYIAGQYILSKISEARERITSDRIARENLRRRFEQNQEDCTFTVLALLPTAAENILDALPVENLTHELQQQKAERLGRSVGASELAPSERSSGTPSVAEDDGRSLSSFQTESFLHTSQLAGSTSADGENSSPKPRKTKAQLWTELKISSITRSFTLLYTLGLLTLLTRIQLNLLGRRNYLSSVVSLASYQPNVSTISLENHDDDRAEQTYSNDFETNRKFLTFSWWLLHRGWRDIMVKVEATVKEVFGPLNPREDISLERLSSLIVEVRKKVEGTTEEERRTQKWLPYLLPPLDQEAYVLHESGMSSTPPSSSPSSSDFPPPDPATSTASATVTSHGPAPPTTTATPQTSPLLRRLLDETSDLIESPPATHILTLLLDTLFSHLTDHVLRTQAFKIPLPTPSSPSERITEILDISDAAASTAKLATILAVITRQAHAIGNGVPNEYVQAMEGVRQVEAFAAVVYSSHFEVEGRVRDDGLKIEEEIRGEDERAIEEVAKVEDERLVRGTVRGVVDATWGVWDSVWGRVVGGGEAAITG